MTDIINKEMVEAYFSWTVGLDYSIWKKFIAITCTCDGSDRNFDSSTRPSLQTIKCL